MPSIVHFNGGMNAEILKDEGNTKSKECPLFLRKAYHMIDTCDDTIASWSENGTTFTIKMAEVFASTILPQYFRHNNFSSFVRQLNFYGFHKEKSEPIILDKSDQLGQNKYWQFKHKNFVRGRPDMLAKILRRVPHNNQATRRGADGSNCNESSNQQTKAMLNEVSSLQGKLDTMSEDIDKISSLVKNVMKVRDEANLQKVQVAESISTETPKKKQRYSQLKTESLIFTTPSEALQTENNNSLSKLSSQKLSFVNRHLASVSLPDLSLATDADLLVLDTPNNNIQSSSLQNVKISISDPNNMPKENVSDSTGQEFPTLEVFDEIEGNEILLPSVSVGQFAYEVEHEPFPSLISNLSRTDIPPLGEEPCCNHVLDAAHIQNLERCLDSLTRDQRKMLLEVILSKFKEPENLFKLLKDYFSKSTIAKSDVDSSKLFSRTQSPSLMTKNAKPQHHLHHVLETLQSLLTPLQSAKHIGNSTVQIKA